jgi:hypothetical protein
MIIDYHLNLTSADGGIELLDHEEDFQESEEDTESLDFTKLKEEIF